MFSAFGITNGTTGGPILNITVAGQNRTIAIPSASTTVSGVVNTGSQDFTGNKHLMLQGSDGFSIYYPFDGTNKIIVDMYNDTAGTKFFIGAIDSDQTSKGSMGYIRLTGPGGNGWVFIQTLTTYKGKDVIFPNYDGTMYLAHTGSSSSVGTSTKPVYVAANGRITAGSSYAGGTAVTLNGSSKAASTASFYAPTAAGTSGYWLKSAGSGAPTWNSWSVSNTWTAGASSGPTLKTTVNGTTGTAVAIPSASISASGVVTTGEQTFAGNKTFQSSTFQWKTSSTSGNRSSSYILTRNGVLDDNNEFCETRMMQTKLMMYCKDPQYNSLEAIWLYINNYVGINDGHGYGSDGIIAFHNCILSSNYKQGVGSSWVAGHSGRIFNELAIRSFIHFPNHSFASGSSFMPWMRQGDNTSGSNWAVGLLSGQAFYILRGLSGNTENTFASALKHETNGVTYSTAGFATGSDRRLKNVIQETSSQEAYTILKNITIYDYTLKQNIVEEGQIPFENKIQNGIMAQDLIQILKENNIGDRSYITRMELPEFNMIEDYELEEDELQYVNPESMNKSFWCIKYSEMIPLIIKGWQVHQQQIEQLQQENAELRALLNK